MHIVAISELLIIVFLLFSFYHFYPTFSSVEEPQFSSFEEPPALTTEINTTESIVTDLEDLGCKIIYSAAYWDGTYPVENYTDFRRVAYNSRVVFWHTSWGYVYSHTEEGGKYREISLYTIFDGTIISTFLSFKET